MACVWNSPYIFLDKNKQSCAYMCLYAWCEIEGLMASWHKDHPCFVYRELACLMMSLSLYMYETNNNLIF